MKNEKIPATLASQICSGPHIPSQAELTQILETRLTEAPETAFAEFTHLQRCAARTWGAENTAHFAQVLRRMRVSPKPVRRTAWERALLLVASLPQPWQAPMGAHLEASKSGRAPRGRVCWSSAHANSVLVALLRWVSHCQQNAVPLLPTGTSLDNYAEKISKSASVRTAADYLGRILSGIRIVAPEISSDACSHVALFWAERAADAGAPTKTGAQLVGAKAIYDLGIDLIEQARRRPLRGLHAARDFRNGLLLAIGIALPQRARALSALTFDHTLRVSDTPSFHVTIPAAFLKLPESQKGGEPYDREIANESLAAALREYRMGYRPIFDEGNSLFPSTLARGCSISEKQIGRLAGDLTQKAFGTRVSIHRFRDNVATTASEILSASGRGASKLLDHRCEATTRRHYDHATGLAATAEFVKVLEKQSSRKALLNL